MRTGGPVAPNNFFYLATLLEKNCIRDGSQSLGATLKLDMHS